jgi:hypothetical protein
MAATGFRRLFLCFSFFKRGLQKPVAAVAGVRRLPVSVSWRGRRNHHRTKKDCEQTTSGAATNDQGNSHDAKQQVSAALRTKGGEGKLSGAPSQVFPGVGVPGQPSYTRLNDARRDAETMLLACLLLLVKAPRLRKNDLTR